MRIESVLNLIALQNQTEPDRGLASECMRQVGPLEVSAEGKTCFSVVKEDVRAVARREGASTRFEAPLLPLHQLLTTM